MQSTIKLILSFIFLSAQSFAQSPVEILNTETISFNKKLSSDRQILKGNVRVKHDDRRLTCDSAYFYADKNVIEAFGNVHLWEGDSLNLRGNYLRYDGNNKAALINQNVVFQHNDMSLKTEELNYDFSYNKGFFDQYAYIESNDKTLESNAGNYFSNLEKFDFFDSVIVTSTSEILMADTLYYWIKEEYAQFQSKGIIKNDSYVIEANYGWMDQKEETAFLNSDVIITNQNNQSSLMADTCYLFDQFNSSTSFGNILLTIPQNNDTLYFEADTITQMMNQGVIAQPKVRFTSNSFSGKSDSLYYNIDLGLLYLEKNPALWVGEFQITSDSISLLIDSNQIQKGYLYKNAFICSKVDSLFYNQISGVNMYAHFINSIINSIDVEGNGQSIYTVSDEDNNTIQGLNKIICSDMHILLKENAIESISFYTKPDAHLIPADKVQNDERVLKGFTWLDQSSILNQLQSKIILK